MGDKVQLSIVNEAEQHIKITVEGALATAYLHFIDGLFHGGELSIPGTTGMQHHVVGPEMWDQLVEFRDVLNAVFNEIERLLT